MTAAAHRPPAGPAGGVALVHHEEEVMGTVVTFDLYAPGPVEVAEAVGRACSVLHDADAVFSTWKPDSPVSRLRRGEISLGEAPAEVADVLDRCRTARQATDGWFDPWALPGGVDPTGYVKGWAGQQALEVLRPLDLLGAMVNAAGDIASFGGPEPGQPFRVGIVEPGSPGRLACVVELTGAVATSGTYERGLHLIDPFSGRATSGAASASVTGPDLGLADALATALAVAGEAGLDFVADLAGYEGFVIGIDGGWQWTPGFPFADDGAGPAGPRRT